MQLTDRQGGRSFVRLPGQRLPFESIRAMNSMSREKSGGVRTHEEMHQSGVSLGPVRLAELFQDGLQSAANCLQTARSHRGRDSLFDFLARLENVRR